MDILGDIWNTVIMGPMINGLVLLYYVFFNNFGLAVIAFTIIVRVAMVPLTLKQSKQMKAMGQLQPKVKQVQERHKNDRAKASQETMRLYREQGVNPLGCLGPMVIQMPIFFGLFWALRATLPSTPERLADLSRHLYPWLTPVHEVIPLNGIAFGLNLADVSAANPIPFLLPVLVAGSMWLMQKMTTMPAATEQQASTNRMMLWMMPVMFGFFTLQFEAGLAVYWIVSNLVGIIIQGFVTGWEPVVALATWRPGRLAPAQGRPSEPVATEPPAEEAVDVEDDRDDRKEPRGGNRVRPKGARRRARPGRNRRS